MLALITNAPLWIWPLLVLLLFIGWRATRDRSAPRALIYALPAMVVLTLATLARLEVGGWVWLVALGAWLIGARLGLALQPRWTLGHDGTRVRLRGEWVTMSTIMGLFWLSYAHGVLAAVAPEITGSLAYAISLPAVLPLLSGSLAGRAISVARSV